MADEKKTIARLRSYEPAVPITLTKEELRAAAAEGLRLRRWIEGELAPMKRLTADDFNLRSR